ncbi:MAG: FAD/NAD(P)-binding protein [Alphaproteobacteria bacterium]|nr:FAD/NAD(P)-binding protein [Alphaproteobacteria bacterium]
MAYTAEAPAIAAGDDPMVPRIGRVRRRVRELSDVWTLTVEMEDGRPLAFAPGQFNMLTAFGVGEAAISISGDRDRADSGLIHTIRAVGPVSGALTRLGPGDVIGVRGPFGVGWPVDAAKGSDVVIVAGGLGLAPLRPLIYAVLASRKDYGRFALLFGARTPADILFRREIEQWRRRLDVEIQVTVDTSGEDWYGNVGVVTALVPQASFDPQNTIAYVCGPEVMMRFGAAALRDAGVPDTAMYLSMERNMKCGVGLCGHCQLGTAFVCRDGPVFRNDVLRPLMAVKEL